MKIVRVAQMKQLEDLVIQQGISSERLMENAGRSVATEIAKFRGGTLNSAKILILVGPGNNGGDGLVAGRYLYDWGADVTCFFWGRTLESDPNKNRLIHRGVRLLDPGISSETEKIADNVKTADIIIDALFGTGRQRPISGGLENILGIIAAEKATRPALDIVAVDLPSGIDADTGAVDPATLSADVTITFAYPKLGHYLFPGAGSIGRLVVSDIGIPDELGGDIPVETITSEMVASLLPNRPANANKGTFGKVLVIGGSLNFTGAPCLAAMGALRSGAGLVTVAVANSIHQIVASKLTEPTFLPLPEAEPGIIGPEVVERLNEVVGQYDVVLIGPGLGRHYSTINFLKRFLLGNVSLAGQNVILDADGLYALSGTTHWWRSLSARLIITPHPGEMARLMNKSISEIETDRFGYASRAAADWRVVVTLKGAHTIVSDPKGITRFDTHQNPALASGGTGDVLSGLIAGFVAQGRDLLTAACCGVYIHGQAGDLAREDLGDTGVIAGDLLARLPLAIKGTRNSKVKP